MSWSNDLNLGLGISGSPAVAAYDGRLVFVHEGYGNEGKLWYVTWDGDGWSSDVNTQFGTSGGPGLAVFDGKLYCAHQGYEGRGELWYTIFDGNDWNGDHHIGGISISGSPALAAYNSEFFCVYENKNDPGSLWYIVTSDGAQWSEPKEIPSPEPPVGQGWPSSTVGSTARTKG